MDNPKCLQGTARKLYSWLQELVWLAYDQPIGISTGPQSRNNHVKKPGNKQQKKQSKQAIDDNGSVEPETGLMQGLAIEQ